jgi:hypothetical protein
MPAHNKRFGSRRGVCPQKVRPAPSRRTVIIPANIITFVTGICFSKFTGWGFLKHKWIVAKYIINLIPMLAGGIVLAPSILKMLSIADEMGSAALLSQDFLSSKSIFTISFIVILVLLMLAVYLSVFKPESSKIYKRIKLTISNIKRM